MNNFTYKLLLMRLQHDYNPSFIQTKYLSTSFKNWYRVVSFPDTGTVFKHVKLISRAEVKATGVCLHSYQVVKTQLCSDFNLLK